MVTPGALCALLPTSVSILTSHSSLPRAPHLATQNFSQVSDSLAPSHLGPLQRLIFLPGFPSFFSVLLPLLIFRPLFHSHFREAFLDPFATPCYRASGLWPSAWKHLKQLEFDFWFFVCICVYMCIYGYLINIWFLQCTLRWWRKTKFVYFCISVLADS